MMKFLACLITSSLLLVLTGCGTAQTSQTSYTSPVSIIKQLQSTTDNSNIISNAEQNQTQDSSVKFDPKNVNTSVFKDLGDLAFVWQGLLYVFDGKTGEIKQLTSSGNAQHPSWSHDGEWIAYFSTNSSTSSNGQIWIVSRDGQTTRQVNGQSFSWSPTSDVLATSGTDGLWLLPVDGEPQLEVKGPVSKPYWSPDGKYIAYSTILPYDKNKPESRSDALYILNLSTGQTVKKTTEPSAGIQVAAWWPNGEGLLYWVDPMHSCSLAADGLPLWNFRLGDAEPALLSTGLAHPGWQVFSPQGQLLMVSGEGREVWTGKSLTIIDPGSGKAKKLPNPNGLVALDPSFSPDGSKIAFVAAQDLGAVLGFSDPDKLMNWIATRTLWIENDDGSDAHIIKTAGIGIYQPLWSKDGTHILYVQNNSLWLIRANGDNPEKILGPFPDWGKDQFGFYGYIWHDDLSWFQP